MGAVSMVSCHIHLILSSLFVLSVLSCCLGGPIKDQEAGFYTTRFGRSDPAIRMQELTTRYTPDSRVIRSSEWQSRYIPKLWELVDEESKYTGMSPLVCLYSTARNGYSCSKMEPWSLSRTTDD